MKKHKKKFEYMQIDDEGWVFDYDHLKMIGEEGWVFDYDHLKMIGEEGWEMCGVSQNISYGGTLWNNYYFKRKIR